jgi:hypothetical protein
VTETDNSEGESEDSASPHLLADPAQLFAGMQVGLPSLVVVCSHCGDRLGEGDEVSVYAYRPAETTQWFLGRCCCLQCAPKQILTPTLGTAEYRLTARLAVVSDVTRQQQRLCLAEPTIRGFASPADGTSH